MTLAIKENRKQQMLLTKEEIKLIERLRQLKRVSERCLVIVCPDYSLSWFVANKEES